jgi:hypothetical protein
MFKQHVNTPRYSKDAATKSYVDTVFSRVKAGASSSVFDYRVDATTTSAGDPGGGKFRYSDAGQKSYVNYLYMDWTTQDGFDVVALFTAMKFNDTFIIQDKDMSLQYQKWRLLGPAVNMPDYFVVEVEYLEGDAVFTNNQLVSFVVMFMGQEGEPGSVGPQGEQGLQGPAGPGVPVGGTANQVLAKIDSVNYNTRWVVPSTGDVSKSYVDTQDNLRVLKAGDTMTGALIATAKGHVFGNPSGPSATAAVAYTDANILLYSYPPDNWVGMGTDSGGNWWLRTGGSGSRAPAIWVGENGFLNLTKDPTSALHAATKQYVDGKVVTGNYLPLTGGGMQGRIDLYAQNYAIGVSGCDNITTRMDSGFFQCSSGTVAKGYPTDNGWHTIIACTHSNNANYYSMQLAMTFAGADQRLYFRQTDNNGAAGWRTAWDNVAWNDGTLRTIQFRQGNAGAGAGAWYDTAGVVQRFFIGTEGGTDEWRVYSTGGGNIMRWHGYDNTVVMPGWLQAGGIDCAGNVWCKGGVLYMSAAGHYINWDGGNYIAPHGNLLVGGYWVAREGLNATHNELYSSSNMHSNGNHYFMAGDGVWRRWRGDLGRVEESHGTYLSTVHQHQGSYAAGYYQKGGVSGGFEGARFNIQNGGPAFHFWSEDTSYGAIYMGSDYRIKKNVKELPTMWDKVRAMRPVSFELNGKGGFTEDGVERWGFIAHELQDALTESVANGRRDCINEIQAPWPMAILAPVVKALQEVMDRVERLER